MEELIEMSITQLKWLGSTKKNDGTLYKRNVFLVEIPFFATGFVVLDAAQTKLWLSMTKVKLTAAKPTATTSLVVSVKKHEALEAKFHEWTLVLRKDSRIADIVLKPLGD